MEQSIEQKLRAIYYLQQIDSQIDHLRVLRGELPREVKNLEDEIAGMETRMDRFNETLNGLKRLLSDWQSKLNDYISLKSRYEQQIDGVKNRREFDAISKEIEFQGIEIEIANKRIAEQNAAVEVTSQQMQAVSDLLTERYKDLEIKKTALDGIVADTEKEELELIEKSKKAQTHVEERLLSAYLRIRGNARNGLAVVAIERDACGGCFNHIPPQRQMDIRLRKKITVCEHCGRILVDPEINLVEA
jgi:predicted  nucleic acid-binding Zn-ribbon protein